jgi:RHS repeat-associated protein
MKFSISINRVILICCFTLCGFTAAASCDRVPSIHTLTSGCSVTGLVSYYGTYNSETNTYNQGPFYFEWFRSTPSGFQSVYAAYGVEDGEGGVVSTFNGAITNGEVYYVVVNDNSCGNISSEHLNISGAGMAASGVGHSCNPGFAVIQMGGAPAGSSYNLFINGIQQSTTNQSGLFSIAYQSTDIIEGSASNGSCSSTRFPISVVNEYLVPVTVKGNIICNQGSFTLQATNYQSGYFYWYKNGTLISNQHGPTLTGNTSGGTNYAVAVKVTELGTCISGLSDASIIVRNSAPVEAGPPLSLCTNSPAVTLTGMSPQGGFWKGEGIVNNNQFSAAASGVGNFVVTYTYATLEGCSKSDTRNVTVTAVTKPVITQSGGNPGEILLSVPNTAGHVYKWYYNGAQLTGVSGNTYIAQASGSYKVEAVFNGCAAASDPIAVSVNDENYIIVNTVRKGSILDETALGNLTPGSMSLKQSITYFDGLGRSKQNILTKGSPTSKDVVTPMGYDAFGREQQSYLPYTSASNDGLFKKDALQDPTMTSGTEQDKYRSGKQYQFYQGGTTAIPTDQYPYAKNIFETSPLNRPVKQGAAGQAWQPDGDETYTSPDHTVKKSYELNLTNEVLNFEYIDPVAPTYPTGFVKLGNPAFVQANQLSKNKTRDEHGNEVMEFTDKDGRTVLKKVQTGAASYAQTYYVYNELGSLACVIPPEAVQGILLKLAITWTNKSNVTVGPAPLYNELTKPATAATGYGNSGATISGLAASTDGWVEMVAVETNKSRMIGLAATNVNHGTSIQFAIEFRNNGNIYVWENGLEKNSLGVYAAGTVVRVSREGTQVKYYVDGKYRQTSTVVPTTGAMLADVALSEPSATVKYVTTSFGVNANISALINNYAFLYTYDSRRRMSQKKLPGISPVYMIYDSRDRVVLTQEGVQRGTSTQYWTFTKYDELNRPVATGIKDTVCTPALTQDQMQTAVNNHYAKPWTKLYEKYIGNVTGNVHGYTNKSYPVVTTAALVNDGRYLTVNYYDNYQFKSLWYGTYNYVNDALSAVVNGETFTQPANENLSVVGQITGVKLKVLDGGGLHGGNTWLKTVNYYDNSYRVIQVQTDNYKGGIDRMSNLYDFNGKVLKSINTHTEYDVYWNEFVGVSWTGNTLLRDVASGASGAASQQVLPAGQDGWVEAPYFLSSDTRYFGLNDTNPDASSSNINYSFQFTTSNTVRIYENTTLRTTITGVSNGEIFRIQRAGTAVKFYRNGFEIVLSPAPAASSTSLLVDSYFTTNGAALTGVRASFAGSTQTTTRRFIYDNAGRVLEVWHKLNTNPEVRLVYHVYNELGQLIDKKLHSLNAGAADAKQSVDYRYNIRGWVTSINNAALSNDNVTNNDVNDYFGMNLAYNNVFTGLNNNQYFNGNISAIRWSHSLGLTSQKEDAYNFTYDARNYLLAASHKKSSSPSTWVTGEFDEDGIEYDFNGNITKLNRKGAGGVLIDQLTYNYGATTTLSNKLVYVTDAAPDLIQRLKGFRDGNVGNTDYKYDANGNMIQDLNKGIGNTTSETVNIISYNYLNLPEVVKKGTNAIRYVYDAKGRKLFQEVLFDDASKRTDYVGDFNYEGDVLQFVSHEEGRINVAATKLVYVNGAETTADFTATNGASLATANVDNEQFVTVTAATTSTTTGTGVLPIGMTFGVNAGERYKIRVKGHSMAGTSSPVSRSSAYLVTKSGTTNLAPPAKLPIQIGTPTSTWVEQIITIPATVSSFTVGVEWPTVVAGEIFYINDVQVIRLESKAPEYVYDLKDHLGNVRLTFTTVQEVESPKATFEEADKIAEKGKFLRYENAKRIYSRWFDNTKGAADGYAQRLSGLGNEIYGVARSVSVMPGDILNLEVYAKYIDPGQTNPDLTQVLTQIAQSVPTVVFEGTNYGSSTSSFPFPTEAGSVHSGATGTGPKAFLSWLVFDRNYNFIPAKSGFRKMSTTGREYGQDGAHELLSAQVNISEAGYVYVFVSNEEGTNPYEVYFDDLKVAHTKSPVIQTDDYYPFGLTFNSFRKENAAENRSLLNGKETQDEFDLGWADYGARMYMPDIGRWGVVDPLSEKSIQFSPYNYAFNNPFNFVDRNGKIPIPIIYLVYEGVVFAFTATATIYVVANHEKFMPGIYLGGSGSAVLEARGKAKDPYWARYVWRNNRGVAIDVGQPFGNDMEPNPNPNSKDNKPGKGYRYGAIAAIMLGGLSAYQEFKTFISDAQKSNHAVHEKINHRIDAIYEELHALDYEKDRAEHDKLVEEKETLQELRNENEMVQKQLEATEDFIDHMHDKTIVQQDATRVARHSDQYYDPEFLKWYYATEDDEDENKKKQNKK